MKQSHRDREYFRRFAGDARRRGLSLADYYLAVQRSGSSPEVARHQTRGLDFAAAFIEPEQSCLILGCGVGAVVARLFERGIRKVTRLDISSELLTECRRRHGTDVVCADMRATGLPDRSFDVVLTHRSLHHLFYPFEALEELARVTKHRVLIAIEPTYSVLKTGARRISGARMISPANIYEYQCLPTDVHRYMAFNGFGIASSIRYWETTRGSTVNWIFNVVGRPLGNRFAAAYERIPA